VHAQRTVILRDDVLALVRVRGCAGVGRIVACEIAFDPVPANFDAGLEHDPLIS
jgi:hypothetical protein